MDQKQLSLIKSTYSTKSRIYLGYNDSSCAQRIGGNNG